MHDLADITKLEQYVEESIVFLLFLSRAYFLSVNCLREIRAAVALNKPLVLVYEPSADHGGGTPSDLLQVCGARERLHVFHACLLETIASVCC